MTIEWFVWQYSLSVLSFCRSLGLHQSQVIQLLFQAQLALENADDASIDNVFALHHPSDISLCLCYESFLVDYLSTCVGVKGRL